MLRTLNLITCPYCPGRTGQIVVETPILARFREDHPTLADSDEAMRLLQQSGAIGFNSPSEADGPCPHLLHLLLDCGWGPENRYNRIPTAWSACLAWKAPALAAEDARDRAASDYLWDVLDNDEGPRPGTPFRRVRDRCLSWRCGTARDGAPAYLGVEGSAWFTPDAAKFLAELRELERLRQAELGCGAPRANG